MSASSTAVIAAIAAQRRKLIRHFVTIGAVAPERAVAPEALSRVHFRMLERLKAERVVCATEHGRLYLDQARAEALQARRQAAALKMIAGVTVAVALAAAFAVWVAT